MAAVYFVLLASTLVFAHELGHFALAKLFGVRVLKFSIGLGPTIAGFHAGGTHYALGLIPIGGYVRLKGEDGNPSNDADSLVSQRAWAQALIFLGGPVMNLVLPLGLLLVVFLGDTEQTAPIIGTVYPDRPADGQLFSGDEILAVDGEEIDTFEELAQAIRTRAGRPTTLTVRRSEFGDAPATPTPPADGSDLPVPTTPTYQVVVTPAATTQTLALEREEQVGRLGVDPFQRLAVVGVPEDSPAYMAGLRTFDRIVAIGTTPVNTFAELEAALREVPSLLSVTYLRAEVAQDLGDLGTVMVFHPHVANINPAQTHARGPARIGIEAADPYVAQVVPGSPLHEAGLRRGDRLLSVDGNPVRLFASLSAQFSGDGDPHTLTWRREHIVHEARVPLTTSGHLAMTTWMPIVERQPVPNPHTFLYACGRAAEETAEMISLTFTSALRLFQGRAPMTSVGGPLTMYDAAGRAAKDGVGAYLMLMAFISINLGILNLLPIPLLDGGHLLFLLLASGFGRTITPKTRRIASIVGFVMLALLMVLAFKNDMQRLFGEPSSAIPTSPMAPSGGGTP